MGKALHVSNPSNVANANEGAVSGGSGSAAVESVSQISVQEAGTWSKLGYNNIGGSGTNVVRLRVASADGNCLVSASGTGWNADNVNTDVISSGGTLLNYAFTDNGTNPTYQPLKVLFEATGDQTAYFVNSGVGSVYDVPSATRFMPFGGGQSADGGATEANAQSKCRAAGTLKNFQVRVTANARTNASVFGVNINGTPGASTVSFATTITGLVVDTTHTDSIADGDLYCATITLLTGVEDLTVSLIAIAHGNASAAKSDRPLQSLAGTSRAANATAHFICLGGSFPLNDPTEANEVLKAGFNGTASNLRIYLSANTYSVDAQLTFRVAGGDGITCTITAGATGWLENTADTTSFTDTDDICF